MGYIGITVVLGELSGMNFTALEFEAIALSRKGGTPKIWHYESSISEAGERRNIS